MMVDRFILFAAAGDWLQFIVPIVFFIIYALNQLLSSKAGPQRKPAPKPADTERPMRPQQRPANPPPANTQSQLNTEIEQFLKRANQRRGEKSPRESTAASKPAKAPKPPRPPMREQPVDVEPLAPRELSTVAESVQKHMANRGFEQRAEHLADDITKVDAQMEEHLQKAFSRRVGTLGEATPKVSTTPATDSQPMVVAGASSAAAGIAAVLSKPENLRQAIIVSEILQRPEHRW